MKRKLLIVLLGVGTILGFSTGFASMSHHWHHRAEQRRAAWEAHVAEVCVGAARRAERPPSDHPDWDEPPPDHHRRHRHRW